MEKRNILEYIRLKHDFKTGYARWQEYPSAARNRAWNRAQNKYENFIKKISRLYHIPNNQSKPIPSTPTVAFLEYHRRQFERQLARTPTKTPRKSRVPPSTPRTPGF